MSSLIQHSTCTLDISNDKRASPKGDRDDKGNIQLIEIPALMGYSPQNTATRRDIITDKPRSPLEGLDA
jgi:hypothetical protein